MRLSKEQQQRIKEASSGKRAEDYAKLPAVNAYSKRLDEVIEQIRLESPEAFVDPFGDKKSYGILAKRKFYYEPSSINVPMQSYVIPAPSKGLKND